MAYLDDFPALRTIIHSDDPIVDAVAPAVFHAPLVASLCAPQNQPDVVLVVTATTREAENVRDTLRTLVDSSVSVWDFPAWETLPHERLSPQPETVARRVSTIRAVRGIGSGHSPLVVVAPIRALIQPVNPRITELGWATMTRGSREGGVDDWSAKLANLGYQRVDLVTRRGEYAVRGGIVDVFPALVEHPVRADFFGNELEELSMFQVSDQRSLPGKIDSADIPPAREMLLSEDVRARCAELADEYPGLGQMLTKMSQGIAVEGMESLMPMVVGELRPVIDFFPDTTRIVELESERTRSRAVTLLETNREFLSAAWEVAASTEASQPIDIESSGFLVPEELIARAAPRQWIALHTLDSGNPTWNRLPVVPLDHTEVAGADGAVSFVAQAQSAGQTVVVCARGHGLVARAAELLADAGIPSIEVASVGQALRSDLVNIAQATIAEGFALPELSLMVLGEAEFFGSTASGAPRNARALPAKRRAGVNPLELRPGDYVVHETHGIGRFLEVVEREISTGGRDAKKSTREFVVVEYAPSRRGGATDKLYVPTDQLDYLSLYVGGESPSLSKMGGSEWAAAKSRARKAVRDIAVDLVKLYSARMAQPGFAFSPDNDLQRELEDAFAYVETPDQLVTIEEVKADMERPIPMDRLIAGDVGFGKTEIAVRAAFKAVQDNKQVAVLAPTTLLVRQHSETFSQRYAPFPVRLATLSRFSTASETKSVIAGLADGSIDVVIGTHRLLSSEIRFRDLGLIVIDEEQRFGVEHKDALKKIRTNVDVLAMSATPIPRTLEMAVTGIREMSTLQTPPENRHPILTFVGPQSDQQIAAAIRRELGREGQVFYVSNRVRGIAEVQQRLGDLVPEARIGLAHGQMAEAQLERVMVDFWEGRYDVLVSTTIIETGIDIANANTLIVERADRFGLSQLHQLRGRVGRGRERAYAYFLFDAEVGISDTAHERLTTLAAHSDLGGGMQIAMKDLELRGAGNLLGAEQAGHIAGVGFDLYLRMIAEAIGTFRGDVAPEQVELRLELPVDARIPERYIDSDRLRLEAYQKLSHASSPNVAESNLGEVVEELVDRYGPLPPELSTLVRVSALRRVAHRAGLSEVLVVGSKLRVVGPPLLDSKKVRLQRLYPSSQYIAPARVALVSLPDSVADDALVSFVEEFINAIFLAEDSPAAWSGETLA